MIGNEVYLDYAATTPVDPEVLDEMLPYFSEKFGNANSSTHSQGWRAKEAVKNARNTLAKQIKAESSEIIFTSGATESINMAIKGVFDQYQIKGKHIISCETEHKATLETLNFLESKGAKVTYLPADQTGAVALEDIEKAITKNTILITIMWVNNETGVIANMKAIGALAEQHQVLLMCDATQAVGKIEINVKEHHIGLMAWSAHKVYGPKGIGALYISRKKPRVSLPTYLHGGTQENGLRSGTADTPSIVGFGKAMELINKKEEKERIQKLSSQIITFFKSKKAIINGSSSTPHIMNIQFPQTKAVNLLKTNKQFCFSLGSACNADSLKPSHVLKSMGLSDQKIKSSIRISIGRFTTQKEVDRLIQEFSIGS